MKKWLFNVQNPAYIFVFSFAISLLVFGIRWTTYPMLDNNMWGDQAQYVLNSNPLEFDFTHAYGHPGGPIIEGAILINKAFSVPYNQAVVVFSVLISSLIIAVICRLCFLLKKDDLWWLAALFTLCLNSKFEFATPPSAIATLTVTLLCLLTLYIYENIEQLRTGNLWLWSLIAGFSIAVRTDIGVFSFLFFLFILWRKIKLNKILTIVTSSFLAFCVFDPFMWFMPFEHISNLLYKFIYHYADFSPTYLTHLGIVAISSVAGVSIALSLLFIIVKKYNSMLPAPRFFIWTILTMTVALYIIFLTSRIQAERYFLPILFIWEVFLPLMLFSLIKSLSLDMVAKKNLRAGVVVILILSHISLIAINILLFNSTYV